MKKFISNCLKILGVFLFICIGSIILNSVLLNYKGYKISLDKNILILGDSHTEYAIDDAVLKNSINLSHSADSYFYSYLKLRKLKKENSQIDTLLLAFSNHNLLTEYDNRWLFNTSHIKSKLRIYTDLMTFSDVVFLFKANPSAVIQGFIESPKYSIKLLLNGGLKERELGKFQPTQRNSLNKDIEQRKKSKKQRALEYSQFEINHLFMIVDFCKKNDIELIFVSTPIHPEYLKTKEKELEFFNEFYNLKLAQYRFLDYSEFNVPDESFQDLDHLNANGAKLFSNHLMKELDKD